MDAKQAAEGVPEYVTADELAAIKLDRRLIDTEGRLRNATARRRDRRHKRQWKRSAARRRAT